MSRRFKPTDDQRRMVESMSACGVPQDDIARVIGDGIDPKTMRKHFRDELDTGSIKANAIIAEKLFQQARGGNLTAMIFWLKTRARWRETNHHEVDMKSDATALRVNADTLPDADREAILRVVHRTLQGES